MLAAIRHGFCTTAMLMTPFLLTACGDDDKSGGGNKFEILLLTGLLCLVSVIHNWNKSRSAGTPAQAAA